MRPALALIFAALATPAAAHPGHFAEIAGHSHWIALGALAAAGLLAGALLGKKAEPQAEDGEDETSETDEAPA